MSEPTRALTESEILAEVQKGINCFLDNTYNMTDLYNHMLTTIREANGSRPNDREQLERLIFKVEELREKQRMYHSGHKQLIGQVKSMEVAMDKKTQHLQTLGYDIRRFKQTTTQHKLL